MRLLDGARLQDLSLPPDQEAVLLQPFGPIQIRHPHTPNEAGKLRATTARLCTLSDDECEALLGEVRGHYAHRHPDWEAMVADRWEKIRLGLLDADRIGRVRQQLIGAYFLSEYTFKSTAYFNPSLVAHPDQSQAGADELRVVMSVRAVGEGHISSVAFREGTISRDGSLTVDEAAGVYQMAQLTGFSMRRGTMTEAKTADVHFDFDAPLSSRILFPLTAATSNGLEDVRLVELEGRIFGTYTAYNGRDIVSQILETEDFGDFRLHELEGDAIGNKGMALFPEKVGGHYAMLGRQDAERVWVLYSDDLFHWSGGEVVLEPAYPHEFMHMGNCGSPMRTEEGWLILTHGVGPVREYTIGAALLDIDDPTRVIARTARPLAATEEGDRHGYVPNAVYSCGGLIHRGRLVVPFGLADYEVRCFDIGARDLIGQMDRV